MTAFSLYRRIWRTYFAWAGTLLPLAVFVFVPLGLIHAIPVHLEVGSLNLGSGLEIFGTVLAWLLLVTTGLLGDVFYSGAVAIALTHPHDDEQPSLREIAATLRYRRLIAVDLIFGVLVGIAAIFFFVPGVVVFVYLGLAAPVVEIEHSGVRAALVRSYRLVRGRFWLVLLVLVPIEIANEGLTDLATHLAHSLLGDSLVAEWLTDTATNVVLTPFYAVAAVLLTLGLIAERDGSGPRLHSRPPSR